MCVRILSDGRKGGAGTLGCLLGAGQLGRGGRGRGRDGCEERRMPRQWLELGSQVSGSWGGACVLWGSGQGRATGTGLSASCAARGAEGLSPRLPA